jgi:uncharacterized membrane protein YphA (DoxX/SURF4 family)
MSADGVGYLSALLLAVVFVVAATAKLRAPRVTEQSFADLGVPRPTAMARAVPVTEVLIAAALVAIPPVGGLAALGSLTFFTTFLVLRLREGVRAPCACFGTTSRAPLSAANIVGNAFLIVLAILALAAPRPTWPTGRDVAVVAALVAGEIAIHSWVRRRTRPVPTRVP